VGARRHHHPSLEVLIDRVRLAKATTLLLLLGEVAGCASAPPATPGPAEASTGSAEIAFAQPTPAVFTVEQAQRGQSVFSKVCSACHGGNEFRGPIFALTWMADPIGHLFEHISTTMPQDRPGSLSGEEYAAVLAYFLQLNGRRAGDSKLPADAELLARMRW
jgi:mono/diheme cytochrome c family protein